MLSSLLNINMSEIIEYKKLKLTQTEFKNIYDTYGPKMFSICYRLLGNRQDAEDVLQDGFIKIYNSFDTFEGKGSFEGWMKRIITNTCINFLKSNQKLSKIESLDYSIHPNDIFNSSNIIYSNVEYKDIFKILNNIPTLSRLIFLLHSIEGYSLSELSSVFNLKESACRCRYMRTRNKVLEMLNNANNYKIENLSQYA